jgi:predicted TIM-barrel enzyme
MNNLKRISEVRMQRNDAYPRMNLNDLVGKDFTIVNATMTITLDNQTFYTVTTGGQAILRALKEAQEHLPVIAKVVVKRSRNGRFYYDLQ